MPAKQAPSAPSRVDLGALPPLPDPVRRYLGRVLTDGQPRYRTARLRQTGSLRESPHVDRWMDFSAGEAMGAPAPAFEWIANVHLLPFIRVEVADAYEAGRGTGEARLFGLFPLGREEGRAELNAGALHRYLAEAVWFPVALLPRDGLTWTGIADRRALATLVDGGTRVSLEFRFDELDEVASVYTPARWERVPGGYVQAPWEGRFFDYGRLGDMRIPRAGEVGWYQDGAWQPVWRGRITHADFEA